MMQNKNNKNEQSIKNSCHTEKQLKLGIYSNNILISPYDRDTDIAQYS